METTNSQQLEGVTLDERYELVRKIGVGGFGAVYESLDRKLDSPVAVKVLFPQEKPSSEAMATFRKEAQLTRKFRHPNVVEVFDYGVHQNLGFIVMEYLQGDPIDVLLGRYEHRLPTRLLIRLVTDIGAALENAHNQNLIHRDLKPSNIMLVDEGKDSERFILLDLGIASKLDSTTTIRNKTSDSAMSPKYAAPEQFLSQPAGPWSDIYSFATMLYQLLTGSLPFESESLFGLMMSIQQDPPPAFSEIAPDRNISPELEILIRQCLEKDPKDRPASMGEVRERFLAVLTPESDTASSPKIATDNDETIAEPPVWSQDSLSETSVDQTGHTQTTEVSRKFDLLLIISLVILVVSGVGLIWRVVTDRDKTPPDPPEKTQNLANDSPRETEQKARWQPLGRVMESVGDLADCELDKRLYPPRMVLEVPLAEGDKVEIPFLLMFDVTGKSTDTRPFYIMENLVTNRLYDAYLQATDQPVSAKEDQSPKPDWPRMSLSLETAQECAAWILGENPGGVPSLEQWKIASGFYLHQAGHLQETDWTEGPYQGRWDFEKPLDIHFDPKTSLPRPVGSAKADVAPAYWPANMDPKGEFDLQYLHTGCRDMSGNGCEFTSHVENTLATTPGEPLNWYVPFQYRLLTGMDPNEKPEKLFVAGSPHVGFRLVLQVQ